MLRMWCILCRDRFRKILFPRIVAPFAIAVLRCVIRTSRAFVMLVARVEAFALGGHVCNAEGTLRHVGQLATFQSQSILATPRIKNDDE
jgi:hypothetical protein